MSDHTSDRTVLATQAADHPQVFAAAFSSGDGARLEAVYEADAAFVTPDGHAVTGPARRRANAEFQRLGLPIQVATRRVVTSGDIALLVVDWAISGSASSGEPVELAGTATDVARRGADGRWRYVIDVPFGVDTP